ncbi:hypothetical protein EYZ11_010915 [Aspergillus tanneri]|uniref:Uncharacterized protein n=1 Tax=Aspergillus tanneri TaxID=1220188 RepID=A0A4S3J450_9EURO|nr:hypothetical protein EYZ11_010915 [Aspergillus tanneri]
MPNSHSTLSYLMITVLFLRSGISNIKAQSRPTSPSYLWKLGLANPNSTTRLGTVHADPMIIALLVNTPQAILSTIYLLWNNLFTRMLLAVEYNDFASERKALRVSTPQGDQRSTYFLSLPYRYAIPLTGTSALLHWLVSQSFYSVQLVKRNTVSHHLGYWTSSVGYSPIAMIFSIGVLALAIIAMIGIGLRRLKAHMPIAGTCSAAISAACHPPIGDEDAASKPVMWGEAPRDENTGERARYAHFDTNCWEHTVNFIGVTLSSRPPASMTNWRHLRAIRGPHVSNCPLNT